MDTLAINKDLDEMQHDAAFHQGLYCFLCLKQPSGTEIRVRASDRHFRQMRRNNKFGTKNMNLATTIGERKIAGENFCQVSERLLGLKIIVSCCLMVINVNLNCQLTPQLSTPHFGS